jgi:quinol monooxygenase YgiN
MAYVVTAVWTAQPGQEAVVLDAVHHLAPASRAEPGNRFYQAYVDPQQPTVFRFFEIYDDESAYTAHGTSDHFARWGHGQAIPVLAGRERAFYVTVD